jgi:hypothetical protein
MERGMLEVGAEILLRITGEFAKSVEWVLRATYHRLFSFARASWPNLSHPPLFGVVSSAPPVGVRRLPQEDSLFQHVGTDDSVIFSEQNEKGGQAFPSLW